ncbi:hypothetical protein ACHHYP_08972 [Achlya hypogyna]|uniref:Receptor ligand binding region domain-containing protein n=1 Tax=Achlya hypogyna TaxID=1202772 RepID=A0A1V9YNL0_ACHHY|nr:hypothetical protein ACHHYP_08972 [Achlya hypogyna]
MRRWCTVAGVVVTFSVSAAVGADIVLGVLVPSLSDLQLLSAVEHAITDAKGTLGNVSIRPVYAETSCSEAQTVQAWGQLGNFSALLGPVCTSSCQLVSSLLQQQRPYTVSVHYGCTGISCSASKNLQVQMVPSDDFKLAAVAALASYYGQASASIAYIISRKSSFLPLVPLLMSSSTGTVPLGSSFLYLYDTTPSLASVLTLVKQTQPHITMVIFDGAEASPVSNVNFVASANAVFGSTVGVVFVGLNLDLAMLQALSSSPLTITVLSITLPTTKPANGTILPALHWSTDTAVNMSSTPTVNLLYDATLLYLLAQAMAPTPLATALPTAAASYHGRTGAVSFFADTLTRVPRFDVQVLVASTFATVGNLNCSVDVVCAYAPVAIDFNWAPATWSTTASTSLLPYGPVVLGVICIMSACSFLLLVRMFFSQSCLAARVFQGFSKHEKSGIEDPTQTQMVVSNLEKKAAERRVQIVLGLQTLLDMTQLVTELVAYFNFVMVYDANAIRIALYSIGLGVELASLPSLLMLRLPIFFRHSPWPWVLNGPKIKPADVVAASSSPETTFTIRKHVHGRQSTVTTLVALQVALAQLQQEHLEVANSLLRLWLQEVPLLGLNIYYVFQSTTSMHRASIVLACCVDFVALGFKTHLFHRLTELYVAQRGVHFDIQMAKLESKQRRSSYT